MLVGRRASADRGCRCTACARDIQRRGVCSAVVALRRCEDFRDYPALRLLSDRIVSGERAAPAAGGKGGEISGLAVSQRSSRARPGTHSHKHSLLHDAGTTIFDYLEKQWLWVPAFAGTTAESARAYTTPARSRSCRCTM